MMAVLTNDTAAGAARGANKSATKRLAGANRHRSCPKMGRRLWLSDAPCALAALTGTGAITGDGGCGVATTTEPTLWMADRPLLRSVVRRVVELDSAVRSAVAFVTFSTWKLTLMPPAGVAGACWRWRAPVRMLDTAVTPVIWTFETLVLAWVATPWRKENCSAVPKVLRE